MFVAHIYKLGVNKNQSQLWFKPVFYRFVSPISARHFSALCKAFSSVWGWPACLCRLNLTDSFCISAGYFFWCSLQCYCIKKWLTAHCFNKILLAPYFIKISCSLSGIYIHLHQRSFNFVAIADSNFLFPAPISLFLLPLTQGLQNCDFAALRFCSAFYIFNLLTNWLVVVISQLRKPPSVRCNLWRDITNSFC